MKTIQKTTVKKVAVKKTPTPATPTAEAAPAITGEPKAKKAKAEPKASKYRGATSGMRVMEYQDATFEANYTAMLTDEELAANWRKEFPNAVAFTVIHVGGARRDFNNGTHAKMTRRPEKPLAKVVMDGTKRRFVTDEESAAEKAEKVAAKVAKTKATKAVKTTKPVRTSASPAPMQASA